MFTAFKKARAYLPRTLCFWDKKPTSLLVFENRIGPPCYEIFGELSGSESFIPLQLQHFA